MVKGDAAVFLDKLKVKTREKKTTRGRDVVGDLKAYHPRTRQITTAMA